MSRLPVRGRPGLDLREDCAAPVSVPGVSGRSGDMAAESVKLTVRHVRKAFRLRGGVGGKDPLLQVLGDVSFDSGSILVDGAAVTAPGRDRGFVFQQASLLPWRTARHNVEFGLELQGIPRAQRTQRANEL